jgi:hypothetical protein
MGSADHDERPPAASRFSRASGTGGSKASGRVPRMPAVKAGAANGKRPQVARREDFQTCGSYL